MQAVKGFLQIAGALRAADRTVPALYPAGLQSQRFEQPVFLRLLPLVGKLAGEPGREWLPPLAREGEELSEGKRVFMKINMTEVPALRAAHNGHRPLHPILVR